MEHLVALADDHHLMRAGLVNTVNGLGGYRVTLEAGNGQELVSQLERLDLDGPDAPALAIVDLSMPVMDGYDTIAWLRGHAPRVRPLALTFDGNDEVMMRAVHAGARGFILKSARPAMLKNALDSLILSGWYNSEELVDVRLRNSERRRHEEQERQVVVERISPREMEFLRLVCDEAEFTYEQIASRMGIQRRSVDNFRIGLFEKFNIKSKTGLVLFAMRWGLINGKS